VKCPSCSSEDIVRDSVTWEVKCGNCGLVIEEAVVDQGPEWRSYNQEQRLARERAGSPMTLRVHDRGLNTTIGISSTKNKIKAIKLKRNNDKVRVQRKDKKLVTALSVLNSVCAKLEVTPVIRENAALIIRKLVEENHLRRINLIAVAAAAVLKACNMTGIPKTLPDVIRTLGVKKEEIWEAEDRISKAFPTNRLLKVRVDVRDYIPRIVSQLRLPEQLVVKSSELVNMVKEVGLTSGKGQLAIGAAAVYILSVLLDLKKTQKEIAETLGITEVTIRNRYRDIVDNFEIEVKL
jgi:transcription initiation factor TFIIB